VKSPSVSALLVQAASQLQEVSLSPRLDAELLLATAIGCSRSHLFAWPEKFVCTDAARRFAELLTLRLDGTPVAYLVGTREFWSLTLAVSAATLVPRCETESLVQAAVDRLQSRPAPTVLDLGTGCGTIALAIANELPGARLVAVDRSGAALAVAVANARRLGLTERVEFAIGDWYLALSADQPRFHMIVSNPPYIASGDPHLLGDGVRREPKLALDGGPNGLAALREICAGAPGHLRPGGWLLVEHGAEQGTRVVELMSASGLRRPQTLDDASGLPRVTAARAPG
jgi:release factor glutamine methyltransferase